MTRYLLSLFLSCLLFNCIGHAQTQIINKLKYQISIANNQDQKIAAILALCDQGYSLHPDTLMAYAFKAKSLAIELNNIHSKVSAMYYESFAFTNKGQIDSSLKLANECIDLLSHGIKDPILLAHLYNQKGRCFMRKNQYKEAINMGYKVIDLSEKHRDTLLQMKGKTLIGWAYLEMGQTHEALNWHLKALKTTTDTSLLKKYGILFANLAINYNGLGKSDSALYYINKAVGYSREHENLFALSNSLAMQAQILVRTGKGKVAEAPLKEVVEIRKLIGDPFYIVSDMAQLGLYYAHNNQPEKGIAICNEGIAIAEEFKIDTKLFFLYSTLAENYKASGNTPKYAEILEKIIVLKDSVYTTNSAEALAEMQTKYELQKKENLIIRQQIDISRQSYLFYGLLLLLFFAGIVAILLFKDYRRKQQMKATLLVEQEKRTTQEAILKAEENERRRIAADLHDNMGAYASAISANVDDLMLSNSHVDNSVLRSMKNNAAEIMLNLRDTIWVLNKEAIYLTGISDRFKNYIQKISSAYPGISIEIKETIVNNISISPENALNMLRIMQEAFHNAIKHSKCTNITIRITSNEKLQVEIIDNGTGIGIHQKSIAGNGLQNMQMRAKANGWQLTVGDAKPTGTLIELHA